MSERGDVSFCGPAGIFIHPGNAYELSVAEDWRPVMLTNHSVGISWDLRPTRGATWSPRARRLMVAAAAFMVVGLILAGGARWIDDGLEAVERVADRITPQAAEAPWPSDHVVDRVQQALWVGAGSCGTGMIACGITIWIQRRRPDLDAHIWVRAAEAPEPGWQVVLPDGSGQAVPASRRR